MRNSICSLFLLFMMLNVHQGYGQFLDTKIYPVYQGNDLGLTYSPEHSSFKIWSPTADAAAIIFYSSPLGKDLIERVPMSKSENGTWSITINKNLKGQYYVFQVLVNDNWLAEVPDPYAKAVGTDGKRAVVVDLKETNPVGWQSDKSPAFSNRKDLQKGLGGLPVDAVVYELHVRDATIHPSSGVSKKGKFIGLTESGVVNDKEVKTGIDHIADLGVTHVHLLPSYDFYSVVESKPDSLQYNWGYDPLNYNVPEGSYSTNPADGITRIKEFKSLVQAMHKKGIRVVMDVVYNHTMLTENSYFNQLVPGYYYRQNTAGGFSNASACGNETASERPMMRKFMLESLKYWVQEYHVDGFRFDLMGIHDIETMNMISRELHALKPDILLYGEGWTAGSSPLPDSLRALKQNAHKLDKIAVFSDDLRDGIKGSVFDHADRGFASGKQGMEESIKFGVVAACNHPQIAYSKVNYSKSPYAKEPGQVVSYCECHDNHVLWDKLMISNAADAFETRKQMHLLSLSIVLTSQGVTFLHAGTEILRTKRGVENSFNAGDSINAINWNDKSKYSDVYGYVKGLIKMRKEHPAFRMHTQSQIAGLIRFDEQTPKGVVAYEINGAAVGDSWKKIRVIYNGSAEVKQLNPGDGSWKVFVSSNTMQTAKSNAGSIQNTVVLQPYSATILYKN
ncbi:MAG: type pullulanase [Bacteroidota bacterium]